MLEGKIITADAMHTQRETCQTIVDGGGDYVIVVKDNQHKLLDDVMTTFHGPCSSMLQKSYDTTLDAGHGRIEKRSVTASDELPHCMDWPGLKQVFMVERSTTVKKTGEYYAETVYGITRKVTKNRNLFPTDTSVLKLLYLATQNILKKWIMPIKHWNRILAQLSIHFEERVAEYL